MKRIIAEGGKIGNMESNSYIFKRMPDGSVPDYNHILDVIDAALAEKKIVSKETERFLYQYKDAAENQYLVRSRYDFIASRLYCDEQRFVRNPTNRIIASEHNEPEISSIEPILELTEKELSDIRRILYNLIHQLKNENQKLVMTAHYVCFAEWNYISRVYGYQDRWAKDVHVRAIKKIEPMIHQEWNLRDDPEAILDISELIFRWQTDEFEYRMAEKYKKITIPVLDDRKLLLNL